MSTEHIGPHVVYEPKAGESHDLDIVFVHGLFGHPFETFTYYNSKGADVSGRHDDRAVPKMDTSRSVWEKVRPGIKKNSNQLFWPRDLLPCLFPHARIMTWGYAVQSEKIFLSGSKNSIFQHSQDLLSDLVMLRRSTEQHKVPLIFIVHSLGGIIVKDALSISQQEHTYTRDILPHTKGVIFLGTPHRGSSIASMGASVISILRMFSQNPNTEVLSALEPNSEILDRISRSFGHILASGQLKVHSFREEFDTKGVSIVDLSSSSIGYLHETTGSLHANHRNMAKMSALDDINLQRIVSVIHRWLRCSEPPPTHFNPDRITNSLPDAIIFDKAYHDCIESLNSAEARMRHESVEAAYKGTCQYIFDSGFDFGNFLSGKTTRNEFWIQAYFFHDRGTEAQKSIIAFAREILYQILLQHRTLFSIVYSQFSLSEDPAIKRPGYEIDFLKVGWTSNMLEKSLMSLSIKSYLDVNLCIFVDALDEHARNHRDLITLLGKMSNSKHSPFFRLRVCMAGRPENVFKDAFRGCPGFAMQDLTVDDIQHYTQERFRSELSVDLTQEGGNSLQNLITDIVNRADGVFLWVRLVCDELVESICEGDTINEARKLLSGIPTELEELYTRALRRQPRFQLRTRSNIFYERYIMMQIAMSWCRPFTPYQLLSASTFLANGKDSSVDLKELSWDQMDRRIHGRSSGLLEITLNHKRTHRKGRSDYYSCAPGPDNGAVQFIHQTAREYISREKGSLIISESVDHSCRQDGDVLILRYIVNLCSGLDANGVDSSVMAFIRKNFAFHTNQLEMSVTHAASQTLEPIFSSLGKDDCQNVRAKLLGSIRGGQVTKWALRTPSHPVAQSLFFYAALGLRHSFKNLVGSLRNIISHMDLQTFLTAYIGDFQESETNPLSGWPNCFFGGFLEPGKDEDNMADSLETLWNADLQSLFEKLPAVFDKLIELSLSRPTFQDTASRGRIEKFWKLLRGPSLTRRLDTTFEDYF